MVCFFQIRSLECSATLQSFNAHLIMLLLPISVLAITGFFAYFTSVQLLNNNKISDCCSSAVPSLKNCRGSQRTHFCCKWILFPDIDTGSKTAGVQISKLGQQLVWFNPQILSCKRSTDSQGYCARQVAPSYCQLSTCRLVTSQWRRRPTIDLRTPLNPPSLRRLSAGAKLSQVSDVYISRIWVSPSLPTL